MSMCTSTRAKECSSLASASSLRTSSDSVRPLRDRAVKSLSSLVVAAGKALAIACVCWDSQILKSSKAAEDWNQNPRVSGWKV